jgi:pilus assembly protein CpaE
LPTALARLGGGGVDAVLLDLSLDLGAAGDRLDSFLKLRELAPQVPIVVLCTAADEDLALRAMRAGAADYLHQDQCAESLRQVLHAAVERSRTPLGAEGGIPAETRKMASIIAVLGVKGGVGTTTVALNVASDLARRHKVILAEMQPGFGTLVQYFKPHGTIRNLSGLLREQPAEPGAEQVRACLWHYDGLPGLSLLFGPQTPAECREIAPGRAQAILKLLAELADYVVVDLPASLSEANREVVESANYLALVAEPDPVCVQTAGLVARTIRAWRGAARSMGTVIVSRALVASPAELDEINSEIGKPLGIMPPEPDLCLRAQTAHAPLVALLPESALAESLTALAAGLEPAVRAAA